MDKRTIESIQKKLRLAADPAASPNEAATAAKMAAAQMLKHGITDAMLKGATEPTFNIGYAYSIPLPQWAGMMAIGVATFMGTIGSQCHSDSLDLFRYKFAGEANDVRLSVWLLQVMCQAGVRSCKSRTPAEKAAELSGPFLAGFSAAVQARLFDLAKAKDAAFSEAKASDSKALLVLDAKAQAIAEHFTKQETVPSKLEIGLQGYQAGKTAFIPTGAIESDSDSKALLN
jgi:uncharacterized protein DUF2786